MAANSFETEANNINVNLDVTGYDELKEYTLDEKFGDIQKDIVAKNTLDLIPWGKNNEGNTIKFIFNKATTPSIKEVVDPWVLHIDNFIPIQYRDRSNPSNINYRDPWVYGR